MSEPEKVSPNMKKDVWIRWEGAWQLIYFLSIVISLVSYYFEAGLETENKGVYIYLAIIIILHWGGLKIGNKQPNAWHANALYRFLIIIGESLAWILLVSISPIFYIILFGLFFQVFRYLPIRYAISTTIILMVATVSEQLSGVSESFSLLSPTLWIYVMIGIAGILFGNWISEIIKQSAERRELIERLEAAQIKLASSERREGILAERQRLGSEIHDTLAQGFTSIVMLVEGVLQILPEGVDKTISNNLRLTTKTARNSLEQARRLVWELRPEPLENASLVEALGRVCISWEDNNGIKVHFEKTGVVLGLHPEMEIAFLRTLQEGLHNIQKHAKATIVNVTLSYIGELVVLDLTDNGIGFDHQGSDMGQYGLISMNERAIKLGGKLLIESEIDKGTVLTLELPVWDDK